MTALARECLEPLDRVERLGLRRRPGRRGECPAAPARRGGTCRSAFRSRAGSRAGSRARAARSAGARRLGLALEQAVLVLERRRPGPGPAPRSSRPRRAARRQVRDSRAAATLPSRDELVERLERLLDRRHAVRAVVVVEVDAVGAQAPERVLDRPADVVAASRGRRLAVAASSMPNLVASTTRSRRPSSASPRKRSLPPLLP